MLRTGSKLKKTTRLWCLLLLSILLVVMAGCSESKAEETEEGPSTEDYQAYETHLQNVFEQATTYLNTFSTSLDGLYTGGTSEDQFSKVMKDNIIEESRALVAEVESFNVNSSFFEINQQLTTHLNSQHQLFLDAVDMVNSEKVNKDKLRTDYLKLKDTQAAIINMWKQL